MVDRYLSVKFVSIHLTVSEKTMSMDGRTTDDGRPRHDSSSAVQ